MADTRPTYPPLMFEFRSLSVTFDTPDGPVIALDRVTGGIPLRAMTVIHGESGSGKTTLLHVLAGLEVPTGGEVLMNGVPMPLGSAEFRRRYAQSGRSVVHQELNLFSHLTAAQNVAVPLRLLGVSAGAGRERALDALDRFKLLHLADRRPAEMSHGQRQRVAVARAAVNPAPVLFADEPTSALDGASTQAVVTALRQLVADGKTVVMVTHNPSLIRAADWLIKGDRGKFGGLRRVVKPPRQTAEAAALADTAEVLLPHAGGRTGSALDETTDFDTHGTAV